MTEAEADLICPDCETELIDVGFSLGLRYVCDCTGDDHDIGTVLEDG